jgi:2-keto-3-deoxy-L-rhamnonate aldolase RhmA
MQHVTCDLDHARAAKATVRLEIKSTRANRPGHPMVRVVAVCATHARQLRELGLELVRP